jgi:hypothetical protein
MLLVGVGDLAEAGEGVLVGRDGLLVGGPIGAILLLLTGRRAGLAQLSGPGARELGAVGVDQQAAQDLS